jgi:hypothetical protein
MRKRGADLPLIGINVDRLVNHDTDREGHNDLLIRSITSNQVQEKPNKWIDPILS